MILICRCENVWRASVRKTELGTTEAACPICGKLGSQVTEHQLELIRSHAPHGERTGEQVAASGYGRARQNADGSGGKVRRPDIANQ